MTQFVELPLVEGGSVLVEVEDSRRAVTRGAAPSEVVTKTGETLEHVLGRLGPALRGIASELRTTAGWPDEVEIEFSIRLSTDANIIIARTGGEANFRVALRWAKERP